MNTKEKSEIKTNKEFIKNEIAFSKVRKILENNISFERKLDEIGELMKHDI